MIKIFNYFIQSIVIYIVLFSGKILGIKYSRVIFSSIFSKIGPFFKSNKIIEKNLNIYKKNISEEEKKKDYFLYVEKLRHDFYRVYIFKYF